MLLSLVVTSYTVDRTKEIINLLESVKAQTYTNIEVIVVIEGSKDLFERLKDYREISLSHDPKLIFLNSKRGASYARNVGAEEATGEIVAFVDDDVVLSPDWAENLVKSYKDESIVGVTGQVRPQWEEARWDWFPEEFDWVFGCSRWLGLNRIMEVRSVIGANASFKKEAFISSGGYSTTLGACHLQHQRSHELHVFGEEAELCMRMKTWGTILYNPNARVYHKVQRSKLSWSFISQRAYQVGRTRRMLSTRFPNRTGMEKVLQTEYLLLSRLPQSFLKNTLSDPGRVLQRTLASVLILFFVFLGFLSPITGTSSIFGQANRVRNA